MGRQTVARATRADANGKTDVDVQHTSTDSPIIPVESLERLHNFRPDLVDWYIQETTNEANSRRTRNDRTVNYIFIERIASIAVSLIVCVLGILGGGYVALHGEPTAGAAIATVAIGTLAVAYLNRSSKPKD